MLWKLELSFVHLLNGQVPKPCAYASVEKEAGVRQREEGKRTETEAVRTKRV